jgi:hypothetical protein
MAWQIFLKVEAAYLLKGCLLQMNDQYSSKAFHVGTLYMIVVRRDFNGTGRQTIC